MSSCSSVSGFCSSIPHCFCCPLYAQPLCLCLHAQPTCLCNCGLSFPASLSLFLCFSLFISLCLCFLSCLLLSVSACLSFLWTCGQASTHIVPTSLPPQAPHTHRAFDQCFPTHTLPSRLPQLLISIWYEFLLRQEPPVGGGGGKFQQKDLQLV